MLLGIRLQVIASRLEAIASRLEAIASRLEAIAIRLYDLVQSLPNKICCAGLAVLLGLRGSFEAPAR